MGVNHEIRDEFVTFYYNRNSKVKFKGWKEGREGVLVEVVGRG
jgi:hypothetical protein